MSMTNQIPAKALDMIQQEARVVFYGMSDAAHGATFDRAVDAAVQHALNHALEEGILEIAHPPMSKDELRIQDLKRGEAIMAGTPEARIFRDMKAQAQVGNFKGDGDED